jgi:phage-related protein
VRTVRRHAPAGAIELSRFFLIHLICIYWDKENYNIDYIQLDSGIYPFKTFLESMNIEERAEILSSIEELKFRLNSNLNINNKISKHLRKGIFELRVRHKTRISRSLYFFQINKMIVFTSGFIKKTEETPNNEIEKAIKYRQIYIEKQRNENNT